MFGNKGSAYRRGGTRGGADQFKWDSVKTEKNKDFYLGHSAMAPVGRWQNGKDVYWYTKNKEEQDHSLQEERERIRLQDEEKINEKLGLATKKRKADDFSGAGTGATTLLDQTDVKQLLSRQQESTDGDRIKGLGAALTAWHEHIDRGTTKTASLSIATAPASMGKLEGEGEVEIEKERHKKKKHDHKDKKEHKERKEKKDKHKKERKEKHH